MHRGEIRVEAASVQPIAVSAPPLPDVHAPPLSSVWIALHPVTVFLLLSLAFGAATVFVVPPLRGPDEIAHFLRIHSYARGELLPAAEVDGRKGILVEGALHAQLHFFKEAGEWFAAAARGRDLRRSHPESETAGWHERADRDCRGADLGYRHGRSSVPGPLVTWPTDRDPQHAGRAATRQRLRAEIAPSRRPDHLNGRAQ
jgi:hypothetical protein